MNKDQIAEILIEIGVLLELKGENPFKTRAYTNAARTIESLSEPLSKIVAEDRLGEIKGVGEGLAKKIAELVKKKEPAELSVECLTDFVDEFLGIAVAFGQSNLSMQQSGEFLPVVLGRPRRPAPAQRGLHQPGKPVPVRRAEESVPEAHWNEG